MLTTTDRLNSAQLEALQTLAAACLAEDGGLPKLYFPLLLQSRRSEPNWFFWREKCLLAFLSIYFFYPKGCELSLMVAPEVRGQGLATTMLKHIVPLLKREGIEFLIFSSAKGQLSAQKAWFHEDTEVKMSWQGNLVPFRSLSLCFRSAAFTDRQAFIDIDKQCFPKTAFSLVHRIDALLADKNYALFLAEKDHQIIGKSHLFINKEEAVISDFAILPAYQAQGYGAQLLSYSMQQSLARGCQRMSLELSYENKNALGLYKSFGFEIKEAWDFWNISRVALEQKLAARS